MFENLALRQQPAIYRRKQKRPRLTWMGSLVLDCHGWPMEGLAKIPVRRSSGHCGAPAAPAFPRLLGTIVQQTGSLATEASSNRITVLGERCRTPHCIVCVQAHKPAEQRSLTSVQKRKSPSRWRRRRLKGSTCAFRTIYRNRSPSSGFQPSGRHTPFPKLLFSRWTPSFLPSTSIL